MLRGALTERKHSKRVRRSARFILPIIATLLAAGCTTTNHPKPAPPQAGRPDVWARDTATSITIIGMGSLVNSSAIEYAPTLTRDELRLFFVSNRYGGRGGHDIWSATRTDGRSTAFSTPRLLKGEINSGDNEGAMAIAPDDSTIIFTACNRSTGIGDCDLYTARLAGDSALDVRIIREVDTKDWESQPALSGSWDTLYFSSNRIVGNGESGSNLWFARRLPNGAWSAPEILGPQINSPSEDQSPCVTGGGAVLLFTSDRPGGYGGYDIYYSLKGADGSWGRAVNLGARINSKGDERSVTASADGMTLYIASDRNSMGAVRNLNLYMVYPGP